jgi:hypothetical protein
MEEETENDGPEEASLSARSVLPPETDDPTQTDDAIQTDDPMQSDDQIQSSDSPEGDIDASFLQSFSESLAQMGGDSESSIARPIGAAAAVEGPLGEMYVTVTDDIGVKVPEMARRPPPPAVSAGSTKIPKKVVSRYTLDEIASAADTYVQTGRVTLSDPLFLAEVIEELTSRRIERMMCSEYLKAHALIEKINQLKGGFQGTVGENLRQQHLERLEERKTRTEAAIKASRAAWRERFREMDQISKDQIAAVEARHETRREAFEQEWSDPRMQRQFNKQSKELLASRQEEKFLALAGELREAEKVKRINQKIEKEEIATQSSKMADAFESARGILEEELREEINRIRGQHNLRREEMLAEEYDQQEELKKRLDLLTKLISEEKLHPKVIRRAKSLGRPTLPIIGRTVANIQAASAMRRQAILGASGRPLPLPPLVIKKRKRPVMVVGPE